MGKFVLIGVALSVVVDRRRRRLPDGVGHSGADAARGASHSRCALPALSTLPRSASWRRVLLLSATRRRRRKLGAADPAAAARRPGHAASRRHRASRAQRTRRRQAVTRSAAGADRCLLDRHAGRRRGALPRTMWQGTPRAFVAAALPLLQPTISPVLQDLARRLLLSNAASPAGPDAPDRPSLGARAARPAAGAGRCRRRGGDARTNLPADPTGDGLDPQRVELRFAAGDRGRRLPHGRGRHQPLSGRVVGARADRLPGARRRRRQGGARA